MRPTKVMRARVLALTSTRHIEGPLLPIGVRPMEMPRSLQGHTQSKSQHVFLHYYQASGLFCSQMPFPRLTKHLNKFKILVEFEHKSVKKSKSEFEASGKQTQTDFPVGLLEDLKGRIPLKFRFNQLNNSHRNQSNKE